MTGKPLKIGVILSGCGVYDGAEIHETVLTLLAISRAGAQAVIFAPDIPQHHVVNHLTGAEMAERRNVLVEAARIARGAITDLAKFDAAAVDALVLPGGFGAAKNLSSFAFDGPDCRVDPSVARAVRAIADAGKPIAALCIAPAVIAKVLGDVELTIGTDADTAAALEKLGAHHRPATVSELVIDRRRKVVSAPCYMLTPTVAELADSIDRAITAMIALAA